jgi:hypothetical protein
MKSQELIKDGESLVSARYKSSGTDIPVYDDGFGRLFIYRNSIGVGGIVRAQSWEDAYNICEDEFFPEADETMEDIVREYGFKRDHLKIIHPAIRKTAPVTYVNGYVEVFNIDHSIEREATMADYELTGGKLLDGQFVRWEIRDTPDPDAGLENGLFCEAFGFRPNGPNTHDKIGHGIYSKDLNGEFLDTLTKEMLDIIGIELMIDIPLEM